MLPFKIKNETKTSLLTLLLNVVLEILARLVR